MICKNCGNQFQLKYCNNCGQKADTHRITWKEIRHQLSHSFHLDHSLSYTIQQLAKRPGHMIREYLEGKRIRYFNPFFLVILMASIFSYLFVHFHIQTVLASIRMEEVEARSPLVAHKFFAIRSLIFCFVCSIGDYFFFREKKYSMPEIVVANFFIFSGVFMLQVILIPILALAKNSDLNIYVRVIAVILVLAYLYVSRYQLFEAKGNWKLSLKIIMALICYLSIILIIARFIIRPFFLQ